MTYALRCAATSLEVVVRRFPERGYPCAMLNSMALGRASGLWGKLLLKDFIHAQSWTRRARYERAWCGGPNGIFKEVAQSLWFKIKGSARNVVKAR